MNADNKITPDVLTETAQNQDLPFQVILDFGFYSLYCIIN